MTANDRRRESRLARRIRETRIALGLTLVVALAMVLGIGIRSRANFACAAASIASASAQCGETAEAPVEAVRVVFTSDSGPALSER